MTRQENNPEAKQPGRNRLGKLYPSLVNKDVLPDESLDAAQINQQVGSIDQTGWHTKLNIEALCEYGVFARKRFSPKRWFCCHPA